MRSGLPSVCVVAVVLATATPALADELGVAEQLFREGKRLMTEGKIADACRAFEGSYNKEKATSTLLNLADCHEKNGKFASAWAAFVEAERQLRQDPAQAALHDVASHRAAALEPRLSRLRITVSAAAALAGLEVRRGNTLLDHAEWSTWMVVDGGEYVVEVRAPDREAWSSKIAIASERDSRSIDVPVLAVSVDGDLDAPGLARPVRRDPTGLVVAGAGGVLVAGALIAGYLAKGKLDDAKALCGEDLRCATESDRAAGQTLIDASRLRGNVATGLAVGGVAAIGVGVSLWLLRQAPTREPSSSAIHLTPLIDPGHVGLAVGGAL